MNREKFVDRAESLGGSIQLEFYKTAREFLKGRHNEQMSTKLAAAMANHVFRFGLVAPDHASDKQLLAVLAAEKKGCLSSFGDTFKTNATGVLILLAAAWEVELKIFKSHMEELSSYDFVKTGNAAPNVGQELSEWDLVYMNIVVSELGLNQ